MPNHRKRGRKDHYVPQGYLRGFIDPLRVTLAKPLWHYDIATKIWSEKSTGEIGWERGFYDYAGADVGGDDIDQSFAKYEREFPLVRDHILKRRYKGWVKQHRFFLLCYMQMMRARSPLFIRQQTAQNRNLRGATVTAVDGNKITVDSLELRPLPENAIRNRTISQVKEEIKKGADWMWDFHWCLRYARSIENGFATSSHPLVLEGNAPTLELAMKDHRTLLWFPLCWQACLIGSPVPFDVGTEEASPETILHVRQMYARDGNNYVLSPCRVGMPEPDDAKRIFF